MTMTIRPASQADAQAIADIYNHYIANTVVTFEEVPVAPVEMAARIQAVVSASLPWLVGELVSGDQVSVAGYAYATPWKSRSAYRYSVESSVYLAPGCSGQGLGTTLYKALLEELKRSSVHSVMGGIALPNVASVALHERLGFRKVAQLQEVGYKSGQWLDVGYWQILLPG
ncbi:MAG: phosphinothricin acetyltransferase [Gammaproteobacteria bacterium]|nr:phosphinothricin acetyltransferase [Gammaproteobacteria bacterium]|tara:strand:+ start:250 stop:762 length:513 start_codon:yes stop_codon:yes gene_type:complete